MQHIDSAMSSSGTTKTSKQDVRSTAGLHFLVIANTSDIQTVINETTDKAILELLQPPAEKKLHSSMPCKFSCCRNEGKGSFFEYGI